MTTPIYTRKRYNYKELTIPELCRLLGATNAYKELHRELVFRLTTLSGEADHWRKAFIRESAQSGFLTEVNAGSRAKIRRLKAFAAQLLEVHEDRDPETAMQIIQQIADTDPLP